MHEIRWVKYRELMCNARLAVGLDFSAVRRRNKISKSLGLRRSASSEHFSEFRITGVSASLVVLPFVNSGGSVFREFEGTILLS